MQALEAAQRREDLVRQIRLRLLASKSSKEADELEEALREAMKTIQQSKPKHK